MRWWIALSLLAACAHAPSSEPRDFSSTNPSRAPASELAKAGTVTSAIARAAGKSVIMLGYLCEDRSKNKCPPCPDKGECAACDRPAWLFCDDPGAIEAAGVLRVVDPPPEYKLTVGQHYLVKGLKTDTREMSLEEIYFTD